MSTRVKIPCTIMRGGTSKGVFFLEKDLPCDVKSRDEILLKAMGSPDKKQISGLGGATSVTSKVAIISVSNRPDADVNYTFAQVSVDKALVSYKGNCGNISSGVGPFAIEKGLVNITGDTTSVKIYNTNTDKIIVAEICTKGGQVNYLGDYAIPGVPGTASPVKLSFVDPTGSVSGKLLPTDNALDILQVPDIGDIPASIVDAANPLVFVNASDLGLCGTETPEQIDANPELLDKIEAVRGVAAVKMGLIDDYKTSAVSTPGVPKMTIVCPPLCYTATDGKEIKVGDIDLRSTMMSMQKVHPTYAMTGAMCTIAAAVIKGSIVNQMLSSAVDSKLRIGHPSGVLEAEVQYEQGQIPKIISTSGYRTAHLIMEGQVVIHR